VGPDVPFAKMPSFGAAIASPDDDMNIQAGFLSGSSAMSLLCRIMSASGGPWAKDPRYFLGSFVGINLGRVVSSPIR
jgi:hypothetical protein